MKNNFQKYIEANGEVGVIVKTLGWIVYVEGLPGVTIGEMLFFENGKSGYVTSMTGSVVEVTVLSKESLLVGEKVARSGFKMQTKVGEGLLGTTVNVLGDRLRSWKGRNEANLKIENRNLDANPMGIVGRKRISRQLVTGLVMVDMMIPIGKGQRELVMGDRKTGKSYLLWHAMVSQAKLGSVCIYAAVGKKKAEIVRAEQLFVNEGVVDSTIIVAASLEDSAGEIYLAPHAAMAIAEYFRDQGRDVCLVMDDMTTHAKFYRELSLISRKFPGRDSYPGDIFHVHSKLLERAGNYVIKSGEGKEIEAAITCLPVVETVQGDVTGYVQTNMMSMTDGHIYFDSDLFFKGRRPAINPFISVTRVGRQTQNKLSKDCGRALFDLFNSYEKTQSFLRFGAELGENSRQILAMGDKVLKFFDQQNFSMVPVQLGSVMVGFLLSGLWDGKGMDKILEKYNSDQSIKDKIAQIETQSDSFSKLIEIVRKEGGPLLTKLI